MSDQEKYIDSFEKITSFPKYIEVVSQISEEIASENMTALFRGDRDKKDLLPRIATIKNVGNIPDLEKALFDEFKRQSYRYLDRVPQNNYEWIALAQHHGLPTRLLDWTENLLVGLWFCVANGPKGKENGVVWIYAVEKDDYVNLEEDKPFEIEKTKVFCPNQIDDRIGSQHSWFTVHKYMDQKKKFIPLNKNATYKKRVFQVVIANSLFVKFKESLILCGINQNTIFPSLDGLCQYLKDKNGIK